MRREQTLGLYREQTSRKFRTWPRTRAENTCINIFGIPIPWGSKDFLLDRGLYIFVVMMQDKLSPPSPPEITELDSDDEMILEGDIEEIIDMDDAIFENASSSGDENADSSTENPPRKDDAVCVFRGHASRYTVFCGALSKNGELAATGSEEDKAYVWNANTGETLLSTGISHEDSVIFAEFNYNDKYVATADMRGKIKLWRISDKSCIWETSLLNDLSWIKWHHSSNVLIAGVVTGEVYMLKTRTNDCKIFAQRTGDKTETGIILPDGKRIAIGYSSGMIHVVDLKSNAVLSTTPSDPSRSRGHASSIIALDCHIDNNLLISVSLESQTILSMANNGKVICILQDLDTRNTASSSTNNVETVAFCRDPTFPAAATGTVEGDRYGKIYIWDIPKQALRHQMEQEGGITKLVWTRTSILFTAGLDGTLRCFDARAGHCLRTFSGHKTALYDLYISSDEKKALTVSDDSTARIFDISSVC